MSSIVFCIVRELPDEWEEISAWSEKLGVDYCGERLPGLAYKVFQSLLKASRKTPAKLQQVEILRKQAHRCAICSGIFDDDIVWDHEAPLRQLLVAQKQAFRAICASCSAEITPMEGGGRALESRFSRTAWQLYCMSPRPPPLVWKPHEVSNDAANEDEQLYPAIDVIRCKRNAMYHSAREWCFAPWTA